VISDGTLAESSLYVGFARHRGEEALPVGLLKLARRGVMESGEFAYGRRYLAASTPLPLNPEHLPLRDATFVLPAQRVRDGGALPLTLRDALPDSWGRKVLEVQQGRPLSDVEALLLTSEDRVGAMVFAAELPIRSELPATEAPSLEDLAESSRRIEAGLPVAPRMQQLLRGGSLGGARPKATFIHGGRRHIAKFASRGDVHDMEVVEAVTLGLAQQCGIEVPAFLLQPLAVGHALLLERFDRSGSIADERRHHYLSASALMDVPYASSLGSYVELAQLLRRLSRRPEADMRELFHRMVFNLVIGNSDDHVKNHGVLHLEGRGWQLAPAFDLVAQLDAHTGYQELAILPGRHVSSLALARMAAPHFGVLEAEAEGVIDRISTVVADGLAKMVTAQGGSAALAARFMEFVKAQADRIRA
jgi:serine/threonine-protein kinase HipA